MTEFTLNVIRIIRAIPIGKVLTYGKIAAIAGNPRGARQVVRVLSTQTSKHNLPWHRVINSKGEIGLKGESGLLQAMKLTEEGVEIIDDRIDLGKYICNNINIEI